MVTDKLDNRKLNNRKLLVHAADHSQYLTDATFVFWSTDFFV